MKGFPALLILSVCLIVAPAHATEIESGPVNGHWYASGNPYNINGEIYVLADMPLYIHEGVEVVFQGHHMMIIIGVLDAIGTENDPIMFTAADTAVGWHGMRFYDAQDSSHLSHCIIQYGRASGSGSNGWGGGMYLDGSNPVITHCTFRWNWAQEYDAAISIYNDSNPTISHCTFTGNSTPGYGGAVVIYQSQPTISYCTITGNSALGYGGLWINEASPTITNCTITGNSVGQNGAGIGIVYGSNPTFERCIIDGNTAGSSGGGIYCGYNSSFTLSNCTVSGNSASTAGGAYISNSHGTLLNTIVEGNTGGGIYTSSQNISVTYCDFHDNQGNNFIGNPPAGLGTVSGTNVNGDPCDCFSNIFLDPLFVNPAGANYFLQASSPCIDAGDPASPLDPDGTVADIGAFYFDQLWVADQPNSLHPAEFRLYPNYPNPFNASTVLGYSLSQPGIVTLTVHNILGQRVVTLFEGRQRSGVHTITWDASDVSSGIYIAKLQSGSQAENVKMILLK